MTAEPTAPTLEVLVPTYRRPAALALTLTGLAHQTLPRFRVVVSDQTEGAGALDAGEVRFALRLLDARGIAVQLHRHLPRRGLAEHRQFLLDQAGGPYALFLDDDVYCEPHVLATLLGVAGQERCGFVGMPLVGLSYRNDVRAHQQRIEPWTGPVRPERVAPGGPQWARHHLHSAANAWHVQQQLGATVEEPLRYKVAWIGGCVLYDTAKLRAVGGFGFWPELPPAHCGEDVLAQLRVMARYGGCGVLPTGAYHLEVPTTVPDRTCDAPRLLAVDPGRRCG